MTKAEALKRWEDLPANQDIMPYFAAIPYKATGSKYGTCGIRIDGTPEFIDAVLSHLKELLQGEGDCTRLGLSRTPVNAALETRHGARTFENREYGAECCYIRLHERGHEAQIMNRVYGWGARRAASAKPAAHANEEDYLD